MLVNNKLKVHWEHIAPEPEPKSKLPRKKHHHSGKFAGSRCIINRIVPEINIMGITIMPRQERTFAVGIARLYAEDHFNRKVGMLESFKRAVQPIHDKEVRKALWDEFWKTRKPSHYKIPHV
jgi:hypothetical protein